MWVISVQVAADSIPKWDLKGSLFKQASFLHFSFPVSVLFCFCCPSVSDLIHISNCSHSSSSCCCSFPLNWALVVMGLGQCCPGPALPACGLVLHWCWLRHPSHLPQVWIHGIKNNNVACLCSTSLPVLYNRGKLFPVCAVLVSIHRTCCDYFCI